MRLIIHGAFLFFTFIVACAVTVGVSAQEIRSKPIRMVVPYPPGGIDAAARVMMPRMQEMLGQSIVLDYRGGANGIIGAEIVARSAPDGNTLLFVTANTMIGAVKMTKDLPWDTVKNFTPISDLIEYARIITAHASLPVNSLEELIDYAKRNPGKLSFGSAGIGSSFHLDGEILKMAAGIDIVHVPYKGTGPMVVDLASGRLEVGVGAFSSIQPFIKSGKLKLLAFMERKRNPSYPTVLTVAEILPGTQKSPSWTGLMAPAGLPGPILQRIHAAAVDSLHSPEAKAYFAKSYINVLGTTPHEFAVIINEDLARMGKLLDRLGIKPE